MRQRIKRVAGMTSVLAMNWREVTTPDAFNAGIDAMCATLQAEKIPGEETEPELALTTAREETGGQDRMHRSGKDRKQE